MIVLDGHCKIPYAYGLSNNLKYTTLPTNSEDVPRHGNQTSGINDTHHFDHVPHVFRLGARSPELEARIIKLLAVALLSICITHSTGNTSPCSTACRGHWCARYAAKVVHRSGTAAAA